MAGRGPPPKPANIRQRTNRKSTGATLVTPENPKVPELDSPDGRKWHRKTLKRWKKVWESPMSSEYTESDVEGIEALAVLWDDFYNAESPTLRMNLSGEIRLQEVRFGLSPIDRSRLHWEIAKGEEAERKRVPKAARQRKQGEDPRKAIAAVK